jgi:hypothetical protein
MPSRFLADAMQRVSRARRIACHCGGRILDPSARYRRVDNIWLSKRTEHPCYGGVKRRGKAAGLESVPDWPSMADRGALIWGLK